MRASAIDVGTNTTRVLVVESRGSSGYRELDRRLAFTRLGRGVDDSGIISNEAMKQTLGAVAEYCALSGELSVDRIRISATSAVRDAKNAQDFLREASKLSGVDVEVLEGEREALLSFAGAISDLPPNRYLVCDIGGGSTEFVLGDNDGSPPIPVSVDVGSVRLTERFLASDPPRDAELRALEEAVDQALVAVDKTIPDAGRARLVGVAGTVTSLAAVKLSLKAYQPKKTHHLRLTRAEVDKLYRRLSSTPLANRKEIPALPEGRADVIVAGAATLGRVMEKWSFPFVVVSEKDLLDGLILEMMDRIRPVG